MDTPDLEVLYEVMTEWARRKHKDTYTALSHAYKKRTGQWFDPHGSWDFSLGEVNRRCHAVGAPALTAVVVLARDGEPGGSFWGCSDNVPPRPSDEVERLVAWARILKAVHAHTWPSKLPSV